MTEPFRLNEGEDMFERPRTDAWIERVRAADAEAEAAFDEAREVTLSGIDNAELDVYNNIAAISESLIAIAAELRAARIARRPGAGQ